MRCRRGARPWPGAARLLVCAIESGAIPGCCARVPRNEWLRCVAQFCGSVPLQRGIIGLTAHRRSTAEGRLCGLPGAVL